MVAGTGWSAAGSGSYYSSWEPFRAMEIRHTGPISRLGRLDVGGGEGEGVAIFKNVNYTVDNLHESVPPEWTISSLRFRPARDLS